VSTLHLGTGDLNWIGKFGMILMKSAQRSEYHSVKFSQGISIIPNRAFYLLKASDDFPDLYSYPALAADV